MKSIKDLREQYDLITEKEEAEIKKLSALVRAGLFDAKKLNSLKRALDKSVDKMTAQEKRMLINLLDSLMSEVLSNQSVYQKVKQNVMKESKDRLVSDSRFGRGYPSQKDMPSVLLLKRKAIRVFPDGQKVGLYYAQAIDKYVTVPFSDVGLNEDVELTEKVKKPVAGAEEEGTEGHRAYNPWKGGGGGSEVMPRQGAKEILRSGSTTKEIVTSKPRIGGGRVRTSKDDGISKFPKQKRTRQQVKDAVKKYQEKKALKQRSAEDTKRAKSEKAAQPGSRLASQTRSASIAKRIRDTVKKRKPGLLRKLGTGAALVGAGLAGIGAALGTDEKEKKYFTAMSPKLKATGIAPTPTGTQNAYQRRVEIAQRKSTEAMSKMNEVTEVNLDGNHFEINSEVAEKITTLYESLNDKNKSTMISMMNESKESFDKIISFALGQK